MKKITNNKQITNTKNTICIVIFTTIINIIFMSWLFRNEITSLESKTTILIDNTTILENEISQLNQGISDLKTDNTENKYRINFLHYQINKVNSYFSENDIDISTKKY